MSKRKPESELSKSGIISRKRRSKGNCSQCSKPALEGLTYCSKCRERKRVSDRERYLLRRDKGAPRVYQKTKARNLALGIVAAEWAQAPFPTALPVQVAIAITADTVSAAVDELYFLILKLEDGFTKGHGAGRDVNFAWCFKLKKEGVK